MTNTEIRSITPEGGDVRLEEVDLDAEREQSQSADREVAAVINDLVYQYDDLVAEATRLLEQYGQDEDLQASLSGLSEIIQGAAHSRQELQSGATPGASAEAMLGGKSLEDLKDGHEYAIEAMGKRIGMMKAVMGATDRQGRLNEARGGVEQVHDEVAIAKDIIGGEIAQKAAQQEREGALDAARKKLDLKSAGAVLKDLKVLLPSVVSENSGGLNKLLDGDGKGTFKASFDMYRDIGEIAAELSKRLAADPEAFKEAGIEDVKQLAFNLDQLSEIAKQRAHEATTASRGVSKRELGALTQQIDRLNDAKLLLSPGNYSGNIARGGKSVDASKRLGQLREGKVY